MLWHLALYAYCPRLASGYRVDLAVPLPQVLAQPTGPRPSEAAADAAEIETILSSASKKMTAPGRISFLVPQ